MPDLVVAHFGVLQCPCGHRYAVDLRNATAACPRCAKRNETTPQRLSWSGETAEQARAALSALSGAPDMARPAPLPRHDSIAEAAAARGKGIINKSQRAEEVARWCCELQPPAPHGLLVEAMIAAGIERERAEKEIVRMLVCDVLLEPAAGRYRIVG